MRNAFVGEFASGSPKPNADEKLEGRVIYDGGVELLDTANWQVQAKLERATCSVHAMAFSPDSKWLATANGPTFDQAGGNDKDRRARVETIPAPDRREAGSGRSVAGGEG